MTKFYRSLVEVCSIDGTKLYCVVPSFSNEIVSFLSNNNDFSKLKKGDYFFAEINIGVENAKELEIKNIEDVFIVPENNVLDNFVKEQESIKNHLREIVSDSRYLLWLPIDESNSGQFVVNYNTWNRAITLLYEISLWFLKKYNELIPLPDISNCDSTIDLWWKEKNLLIAVNRNETANYYGKNENKEVKGEINCETDYSFLSILKSF